MREGVRRLHNVDVQGSTVHVLGSVFGLVEEGARVEAAIRELDPGVVGVGVSPEDLAGLREFLGSDAVGDPPGPTKDRYSEGLARFGEVRLPPPQLVAAVETADGAGVPVAALDLDEETYTDTFTEHVSTWQLFWHTRRERKLEKRPPDVDTAWGYASAWDESRLKAKGFEHLEEEREAHMAQELRALAGEHPVVLAVVEAPRAAGVAAKLAPR